MSMTSPPTLSGMGVAPLANVQSEQLPRTELQQTEQQEGSITTPEPSGNPAKEVKLAIEGMNKTLQATYSHLEFKLHEKLETYYVQVVDSQSKEVIREIPPEKFLDLVAAMLEYAGLLVDERR